MALRLAVFFAALWTMGAQAQQAQPGSRPAVAPMPSGQHWKVLDTFEVGANVYVRALTLERERGVFWVGTSAGVHEVDLATLKPRNTFTRKEGLANEYVFAVGIDHKGYKWFGTNAGGASRYKDGEWKTFFPMHGLADYWIYAFTSQKDGTLWIGTWAGANKVDPKTGKFTTYVKQLINEWVYGLGVDAQDRVWFGTEGGVTMFDGKAWRSWTHKDGLGAPNTDDLPASTNTGLGTRSRHDLATTLEGSATYNPNYVFSILVRPDQSVWAGTWGGGVARYDGKAWSNLNSRDGLAGNIVYSMAEDADGVLWFGTNKGVSRYDGRTWQTFGRKEGLLEENVYAIAVAPSGEVWAGTRRGVSRIGRK
jgi:ligand-binding sensor domain-containing protein